MSKARIKNTFDTELLSYGIISPLPSYALVALINKTFRLDFKNIDDWIFDNSQERTVLHYTRYIAIDEVNEISALCITNKEFNQLLFKKVKDADMILCLDSKMELDIQKLKIQNDIEFIYPLSNKLLKGIEFIWDSSF